MGIANAAAWRQDAIVHSDDAILLETPPSLLISLQISPQQGFSNLVEAPRQFYKFQENSHSLQLTFRCSTKIKVVK